MACPRPQLFFRPMSRQQSTRYTEFPVSEGDLISDTSSFYDVSLPIDSNPPLPPLDPLPNEACNPPATHYDEFVVKSDDLNSDFFVFSSPQKPFVKQDLPNSTPPNEPLKSLELPATPVPMEKSEDAAPSSDILSQLKKEAVASSAIPWTQSPEYHHTHSGKQLLEMAKQAAEKEEESKSPVKAKSPARSPTPTEITKLGKGKNKWQSRITGFISPVVDISGEARAFSTAAFDSPRLAPPPSIPSKTKKAPLALSEEQNRVIHLVADERRNIFFTGAAGTGKSVLLRRIINDLRHIERREGAIAVTASTGLAACNIGGNTLHSFCGIALGREPVDKLVKKVRQNRQALKRWRNVRVLIIDEISMIDGGLFDKVEEIARVIKNNSLPFGGIQLIATGDFFQLPPVFKNDVDIYGNDISNGDTQGKLAFQANSWSSVINVTVELKKIFRQQDDHFSRMLNSIREGHVTDEITTEFRSLSRPLQVPDGITPTELYPLRRDVDSSNGAMMRKLPGEAHTFTAVDTYNTEQAKRFRILGNLICPEATSLKVGAQVMLIKNMDETLVNGSLGKVLGFMNEITFGLVKALPEAHAEKVISGAITAEDGVDAYLEDLEALKNTKEAESTALDAENQLELAITQVLELEDDPYGIPEDFEKIDEESGYEVNWSRKKNLIEKLQKTAASHGKQWPYVRFILPDGTTRDILVQAESWVIENFDGKVEASRSQVPLMLAWALSIHKSQGQTLSWVRVDLRKIFECGQAYVALSRAVNMDGLQVLGFQPSKVRVHADVVEFYQSLPSPLDIPVLQEPKKKKRKVKSRHR